MSDFNSSIKATSEALQSIRFQGATERLRSQLNEVKVDERSYNDMSASENFFKGTVRVNGAGEASVPVTFPKPFTEKPHLVGFAAEILEGDTIGTGFMPTISIIVLGWTTEERPPVSRLFRGAELGVVSTGLVHQKMMVNYMFSGKALENPL